MTLYDSSVLIGYLDGDADAVSYVESNADDRAVAPPLVLYEVYQGEVFKAGPPELEAVDLALSWLTVVDATAELARAAAELQAWLHRRGEALSARDALIAGTAYGLDERLTVADADFDVPGLTDRLAVDFV